MGFGCAFITFFFCHGVLFFSHGLGYLGGRARGELGVLFVVRLLLGLIWLEYSCFLSFFCVGVLTPLIITDFFFPSLVGHQGVYLVRYDGKSILDWAVRGAVLMIQEDIP